MQILIQEIWSEPFASNEFPGDASAAGPQTTLARTVRVLGHKMKDEFAQ